MILIILAIGLFGAATYLLLTGLTVRQREVAVTLRKAKRYGIQSQREVETRRSVNDRIVGPLTAKLAGVTQRFLPRTDPNVIANRLMAAGLARSMSPQMYLALKGGLVFAAVAFGVIVLVSGAVPPRWACWSPWAAARSATSRPTSSSTRRSAARRELMQMELPNVLDLLCVSVEAGLGFDAAVAKLSERMVGPLVDEFGLVLHEMRIGESRSEALKNLSDRVDVPEVSQFCRAIIQADQLGIALSRILRVQSHDMRVRRQLAAEEKAMKAPVKMLFPTVLFVFPSMFVVALGPAALNLMQTFSAAPQVAHRRGQTPEPGRVARSRDACVRGLTPLRSDSGAGSLRRRRATWPSGLGSGLQSRVHRFDSGRRLWTGLRISNGPVGFRCASSIFGGRRRRSRRAARLHHQLDSLDDLEASVRDAMAGWISVAIDDGRDMAQQEGVSLNQLVVSMLAASSGGARAPAKRPELASVSCGPQVLARPPVGDEDDAEPVGVDDRRAPCARQYGLAGGTGTAPVRATIASTAAAVPT